MSGERRQYLRQPGPFDGSWSDDGGRRACRITHLNPGGCFVDSAQSPPPDREVTITVLFGETGGAFSGGGVGGGGAGFVDGLDRVVPVVVCGAAFGGTAAGGGTVRGGTGMGCGGV